MALQLKKYWFGVVGNSSRCVRLLRTMVYVPPPDSDPKLVRDESVLKSIILHDKTYPVKVSRLDEISRSPTGWVDRMVPPPELPFEMKRNKSNRFDIEIHRKGRTKRTYTVVKNIQGDAQKFTKCVQWRLGERGYYRLNENRRLLVIAGFHKRTINTLLQGLGF